MLSRTQQTSSALEESEKSVESVLKTLLVPGMGNHCATSYISIKYTEESKTGKNIKVTHFT